MAIRAKSKVAGLGAWTVAELGAFCAQHRSELSSHAFRILKNQAKSEEVVQEALLKILLAAPELSSEEHALGYVHRTIENLCVDIFRLEGRRPSFVLIDDATSEIESKWHGGSDHADVMAAAEDAVIVRQALSLLSPAERAAIVMWEVEGRSTKEIAQELGIKESTVRHTVSRARASLRRIMSEIVIDEYRGLTALDLLSSSYRKVAEFSKKSSKAALSLVLIFFAFFGFNSMSERNSVPTMLIQDSPVQVDLPVRAESSEGSLEEDQEIAAPALNQSLMVGEGEKSKALKFPGLNKAGIPISFTVADSKGTLGSAYFRERPVNTSGADLGVSQILKTDEGAANIFVSQALTIESGELKYRPTVAFGQSGSWIPLLVEVTATEITRIKSGDYLLTAHIAVESVVETPIKIAATANGRDLAVAPREVITRMVLDPSKTRVLAQAIYVVEEGERA